MFPTSGLLRIPSHDGHLCLWLYPSHYWTGSGFAPVRNVRRWTHVINKSGVSFGNSLKNVKYLYQPYIEEVEINTSLYVLIKLYKVFC